MESESYAERTVNLDKMNMLPLLILFPGGLGRELQSDNPQSSHDIVLPCVFTACKCPLCICSDTHSAQ